MTDLRLPGREPAGNVTDHWIDHQDFAMNGGSECGRRVRRDRAGRGDGTFDGEVLPAAPIWGPDEIEN